MIEYAFQALRRNDTLATEIKAILGRRSLQLYGRGLGVKMLLAEAIAYAFVEGTTTPGCLWTVLRRES